MRLRFFLTRLFTSKTKCFYSFLIYDVFEIVSSDISSLVSSFSSILTLVFELKLLEASFKSAQVISFDRCAGIRVQISRSFYSLIFTFSMGGISKRICSNYSVSDFISSNCFSCSEKTFIICSTVSTGAATSYELLSKDVLKHP